MHIFKKTNNINELNKYFEKYGLRLFSFSESFGSSIKDYEIHLSNGTAKDVQNFMLRSDDFCYRSKVVSFDIDNNVLTFWFRDNFKLHFKGMKESDFVLNARIFNVEFNHELRRKGEADASIIRRLNDLFRIC